MGGEQVDDHRRDPVRQQQFHRVVDTSPVIFFTATPRTTWMKGIGNRGEKTWAEEEEAVAAAGQGREG